MRRAYIEPGWRYSDSDLQYFEVRRQSGVDTDRRRFPEQEVWQKYSTYEEVAEAIEDMVIQGAGSVAFAACFDWLSPPTPLRTIRLESFRTTLLGCSKAQGNTPDWRIPGSAGREDGSDGT